MPKTILLEEFHVTLRAPAGLRKEDYRAMLRVVRSKTFQCRLRRAVREVLARHRALKRIAFTLDC